MIALMIFPMGTTYTPTDYIPILLQSIVALTFVVVVMTLTHVIGGKRKRIRTLRKDENFECGIEIKGNARFPFTVRYFLIAILFVLFDVEVIFLYPWAVNFRDMNWSGFGDMMIFLALFMFGFFYIFKKGALEWD
jgi:NADH-quinone oxidoreductase subunit A